MTINTRVTCNKLLYKNQNWLPVTDSTICVLFRFYTVSKLISLRWRASVRTRFLFTPAMSHQRGWHSRRRDRRYQDERYYDHADSQYYGYGSSYTAQPYAHASDGYYWADGQRSSGYNYNYWRDGPQYAPHPYESPMDYGRSDPHADHDYLAERSYSYRQRQRSDSPHRQYHTRADRPNSPSPYLTPPSFRWRTPDTAPLSPAPQTRSPTPPPPPPVEPDPAYMTLSSEPSHILDNPRSARKLLILDLNGTLLIRSQHNPRSRGKVAHGGNNIPQTPRMRAVQPRPYIPTFCAYLFAPETREWLDTMVWSSAQPHSVADMVGKVFGDSKSKLVAVWDRESLGLSRKEYCECLAINLWMIGSHLFFFC